jgi:hypothetical protein
LCISEFAAETTANIDWQGRDTSRPYKVNNQIPRSPGVHLHSSVISFQRKEVSILAGMV